MIQYLQRPLESSQPCRKDVENKTLGSEIIGKVEKLEQKVDLSPS